MKQLIVICDMEGASGIFDDDVQAFRHGSERWRSHGRKCMTSDMVAVCEAALEYGIDDILIYDGHYAGAPEHNIILEELPPQARVFDTPDRRFFWRRIRGQALMEPFGLITVGQHARNGEPDAYFAHTIQSPPIENLYLNGLHIAEIGMGLLNFDGVPYIANIGCAASVKEARELCPSVACIAVKDKARGWEPSIEETFPVIKEGVLAALGVAPSRINTRIEPPYEFSMTLCEGYEFDTSAPFAWKGSFTPDTARWCAPDIPIGLELFNYVRERVFKGI